MLSFFTKINNAPSGIQVRKGESRPKIICVDDQRIFLSRLTGYVKEALPDAEVMGFEYSDDALSFAGEVGCDILFTEIEMYGKPSGIELARRMQEINPRVNIIFTTVCSEKEYAVEVMELRPSGYLTKVVTGEDVREALKNLLYTKS